MLKSFLRNFGFAGIVILLAACQQDQTQTPAQPSEPQLPNVQTQMQSSETQPSVPGNVIAPMIPYEKALAILQAQDAARVKATPPKLPGADTGPPGGNPGPVHP